MSGRPTLATLRDLVPLRPLTIAEACSIAERQALQLVPTLGGQDGPVEESVISRLPHVEVLRTSLLSDSGASGWHKGRWLILLNDRDSITRQRFSLAHELKHVLDSRFARLIYRAIPDAERDGRVEDICNHFAACLLMPRPWVKRAWATGTQDVRTLAKDFDVSQAAMQVRLHQLGLTTPRRRHATRAADGRRLARIVAAQSARGYAAPAGRADH